jgi:hypothetical protein
MVLEIADGTEAALTTCVKSLLGLHLAAWVCSHYASSLQWHTPAPVEICGGRPRPERCRCEDEPVRPRSVVMIASWEG